MSKLNKIISSIKNGKMAGLQSVQIKSSFSKSSIDFVNILYKEGFIRGFKYKGSLDSDYNEGNLIIYLKYSKTGKNVINSIIQISKPGRRVYSGIRPL
jgi:ribosomal protein S8